MSLINDMLHNLDARTSPVSVAPADYSVNKPLQIPRFNSVKHAILIVFIFVIVVLLLLGIEQGYSWWQSTYRESSASIAPVSPLVSSSDLTQVSSVYVESKDAENENIINKNITHLEHYLQLAAQSLGADRLTTPIHNSAYLYYHRVLALQPNNFEALDGLEKITDRYIAMANNSTQKGKYTKAHYWLMKAQEVNPTSTVVVTMLENIGELMLGSTNSENNLEIGSVLPSNSDDLQRVSINLNSNTQVHNVIETPESQDQTLVKRAKKLLDLNDSHTAINLLTTYIKSSSVNKITVAPKSRRLLFSLILANNERAQAQKLIIPSLAREQRAYMQAKLYVFDGRLDMAIFILNAEQAYAVEDEAYRAFMAGLYYKLERFEDAEIHYKSLLEDFGENSRYWLGLGLAFDQQQRFQSALKAYQRVPHTFGKTDVMTNFVNQRIFEFKELRTFDG